MGRFFGPIFTIIFLVDCLFFTVIEWLLPAYDIERVECEWTRDNFKEVRQFPVVSFVLLNTPLTRPWKPTLINKAITRHESISLSSIDGGLVALCLTAASSLLSLVNRTDSFGIKLVISYAEATYLRALTPICECWDNSSSRSSTVVSPRVPHECYTSHRQHSLPLSPSPLHSRAARCLSYPRAMIGSHYANPHWGTEYLKTVFDSKGYGSTLHELSSSSVGHGTLPTGFPERRRSGVAAIGRFLGCYGVETVGCIHFQIVFLCCAYHLSVESTLFHESRVQIRGCFKCFSSGSQPISANLNILWYVMALCSIAWFAQVNPCLQLRAWRRRPGILWNGH